VTESTGYNAAGDITSIGAATSGNTQLTNYSYNYVNPTSNQMTDQRYSMTDGMAGHTSNYNYDALNRLTGVSQPWSGSGGNYAYGYDNNGNMTSSAFGGATPTNMSYNNVDQLTSSTAPGNPTYGHDANGNQLSVSGGNTMGYNWLDQTTSITPNGGSAINASFAGGGQSERLSNGSTNYQYDGTGLSTATDGGGNRTSFTNTPDGDVVSENIPVGQPGCMGSGGAICTYYYLHDGLGSTVALVDSTGAVKNTYSYGPWGNSTGVTGNVPNPFRYVGTMLDSSTGLYKMGERYYDPSVGRFTQLGSLGDGYTYTGDNPVNYDDVSGLKKSKKPHKKNASKSKPSGKSKKAPPRTGVYLPCGTKNTVEVLGGLVIGVVLAGISAASIPATGGFNTPAALAAAGIGLGLISTAFAADQAYACLPSSYGSSDGTPYPSTLGGLA